MWLRVKQRTLIGGMQTCFVWNVWHSAVQSRNFDVKMCRNIKLPVVSRGDKEGTEEDICGWQGRSDSRLEKNCKVRSSVICTCHWDVKLCCDQDEETCVQLCAKICVQLCTQISVQSCTKISVRLCTKMCVQLCTIMHKNSSTMRGCPFSNNEEVEIAVRDWLLMRVPKFHSHGIFKLLKFGQMHQCAWELRCT
jgi:hypothetical protein